jgi:hypothetical protein
MGTSQLSFASAMDDAARDALDTVRNLSTEEAVRHHFGLPPRFHLQECDAIRDQLRLLRQRVRLSAPNSSGRKKIGIFYTQLDALERYLMQLGL